MKAQKLTLENDEFFLVIDEDTKRLTLHNSDGSQRSLTLPKQPVDNYWELFGILTPKNEDDDPLYDADIEHIDEDTDKELLDFLGINYYEFTVGSHFVSAIINLDYENLDDDEEKLLDQWLYLLGLPNGHWSVRNTDSSFDNCDICDKLTDCVSLLWVVIPG